MAVNLVGDTSQNFVTLSGDTSFAVDLVGTEGGTPSAVTAREQPRGNFGQGTFSRSARRGAKQSVGLAGQLLKSVGDSTGLGALVDIGDDLIQEAFVEAVSNPARITGLDEIKSVGDAVTFLKQTFGEQVFNVALAAGSGGIGGYLAKKGVAKAMLSTVTNRVAKTTAGRQSQFTAKQVTDRFLRRNSTATLKGAAAGTFTGFLPINTGEILQEARDQGFEPELGPNLLVGAASSAFEVLGFAIVGRAIFGNVRKEIVGHTLRQVLARVGHVSLKSLAAEGGTEAVQEAMVIASRKLNDPTFSITDAISSSEGLSRIAFAGVSGAVVGFGLGGVGGVAQQVSGIAGLQRANLKRRVNEVTDPLTDLFSSKKAEDGEVDSIVDFDLAAKELNKRFVAPVVAAFKGFVDSVKTGVAENDQALAKAAAEKAQQRATTKLNDEAEKLDEVEVIIADEVRRANAGIDFLEAKLEEVASIAEKNNRENKASTTLAEEIKEALLNARKLNTAERAAAAVEMLKTAQKAVSKGLVDPGAIAKDKVRVLINAARKYIRAGLKEKQAKLKTYRVLVDDMKAEVTAASEGAPAAAAPAEGVGATSSFSDIARGITAMTKGNKKSVAAVNRTVDEINNNPVISRRMKENNLEAVAEGNGVTIRKIGTTTTFVEDNIGTPVDQLDPETAVSVVAKDKDGKTITREATERGAVPVGETIQRQSEFAFESTVEEVDEGITESVQEIIDEELQRRDPETIFNLSTELEEVVQVWVRSKNGTLMPAILDVVTNVIHREDGKLHKAFETKAEAERVAGFKQNQKKLAGEEIRAVKIGDEFYLLTIIPEARNIAADRQVREVVARGNRTAREGKENKYIMRATNKNGAKVWLHLGEITWLGFITDSGGTTVYNKLKNANQNFMTGLTELMTEYGFTFDFQQQKLDPAESFQAFIDSLGNKVIFGQTTLKQANYMNLNLPAATRALSIGTSALHQEVKAFFINNPSIKWNDIADYLISASNEGQIDSEDVVSVIFEQGAADLDLLRTMREAAVANTEPASLLDAEVEVEGGDGIIAPNKSSLVDEAQDKTTLINKKGAAQPGSGKTLKSGTVRFTEEAPQVSNNLTGMKGNVWKTAGKAVQFVLTMLNIKENVVLYDEDSAPILIAQYKTAARKALSDGDTGLAALLNNYVQHIQEVLDGNLAGNIRSFARRSFDAAINNEDVARGDVLIYVSKHDRGPKGEGRGTVLMHEMGHLVQYTHFDRLSPKLRKEILKDLAVGKSDGVKREAFANWMAVLAANEAGLDTGKVKPDPYGGLFTSIIKDLKRIWTALKNILRYPKSFEAFVQALNTHSRVQRGLKKKALFGDLRTPLAKAIFAELQEADAGPYIPITIFESSTSLRTLELEIQDTLGVLNRKELTHSNLNDQVISLIADNVRTSDNAHGPEIADLEAEMEQIESDVDQLSKALTDLDKQVSVLMNEQLLNANMEGAAERSQDPVFQSYADDWASFAERFKNTPKDAILTLVLTADAELRRMGPFGVTMAKIFHALPTSNDPSLTVFREIRQRAAPAHTALKKVLDEIPSANMSMADLWNSLLRKPVSAEHQAAVAKRDRIMEALLDQEADLTSLAADERAAVKAVRGYLSEMHTLMTGKGEVEVFGAKREGFGLRLGKGKRKWYYPLMLDTQEIDQRRDEFEKILTDGLFNDEQAAFVRQKMTRDENGGLTNEYQEDMATEFEFQGPGLASARSRADQKGGVVRWTPELRKALTDAGFYQKDLATTLIAYTEMAIRRGVWQNRFQETDIDNDKANRYKDAGLSAHNPIAKLQMDIFEARKRGDINDTQYNRIVNDILPAYAGQLGLRTNSKIRNLSSGIVIYQNIRLLGMAVFSSFVDVGTMFARGGWSDHQAGLKILMDKASREDAFIMLEAIGAMRQGLTEHVLNDQALNTFQTGKAKRINDLFFRYNGMEGWTNMMRAMAMMSGRNFLQRHAKAVIDNKNSTSQRYLDDLGISAAKIAAWDGHSTTDQDINAALNRYVDESMIRPEAPIRPVWMSDPGYAVFSHLKGFLYGFHETFLRRVGREARIHQNLLPLVSLGMLALPFAAVGYELRKKLTGSKQELEGFDYFKEVVERSGMPGAFQLVVDMEQADEFGKPFLIGIGGPSVEQLYDFWTKDMSSWVPRALPVFAQSPVLRDWMRDELE